MLTYTPALPEDVEQIFLLNKALIDEYEDVDTVDYDKVLLWVHRSIEKNLPFFTRVLSDGTLAGFYCLMPSDGALELDSLFVLPEFRGSGIGTQILKKCQACSPALFLYVFRRNVRAVALYERLGFRVIKAAGNTRYIMKYERQE